MVDVYLWLYHTDLWDEFYNTLSPIKEDIVLHLGLCRDTQTKEIVSLAERGFPNLQISHHDNAGADILPFITDFTNNSCKQDIFLKIHSKKSRLMNTIDWRRILLHSLIGDNGNNFYNNVQRIQTNKKIGLISHYSLLFNNQEGPNSSKIDEILQYYQIPKNSITKRVFAAGTMFIGCSNLYDSILNRDSISYLSSLLREEKGHVTDNKEAKYCHSLERIFGYICEHRGLLTDYAKYQTIRVINTKSQTNKLHLSITHSGYVFLEEDIKVRGRLLHRDDGTFTIVWNHLTKPHTRKYVKIANNTYVGTE
jgi:lipopolysaccharide biosynthesis protein